MVDQRGDAIYPLETTFPTLTHWQRSNRPSDDPRILEGESRLRWSSSMDLWARDWEVECVSKSTGAWYQDRSSIPHSLSNFLGRFSWTSVDKHEVLDRPGPHVGPAPVSAAWLLGVNLLFMHQVPVRICGEPWQLIAFVAGIRIQSWSKLLCC